MENTEWFGIVRWCKDDLKAALERNGYPITDDNVDELFCQLQHHSFSDCMIAAGWDFIDDAISSLAFDGKITEDDSE
jgi:hypothetical protein